MNAYDRALADFKATSTWRDFIKGARSAAKREKFLEAIFLHGLQRGEEIAAKRVYSMALGQHGR